MLTMPAEMVESLTFPYRLQVTVTVLEDGYLPGAVLNVVGGDLQQDADPPVRRTARLSIAVDALSTDEQIQDLAESLVAGGVLLQLDWTMTLMDGRTFTLPIGLLRAESSEWSVGDGVISVVAYDMGMAVADDRFVLPRTMSGGTKAAAIEDLLTESVPATMDIDAGVPSQTLYSTTWDTDRDGAVTDLSVALGCWWWWGPEGGWFLAPIPTPATSPADWVVPVGVVTANGTSSRENTFNAVVVTGQLPEGEAGAPPYAVAYDDDPTSPTYWDGPFGHKPRFYSSPVLTTDAQCAAAAATLLGQYLGMTRGMTLTLPPHPGLEPGDTVSTGSPAGVFVADEVTLQLDGSPMTVKARRVL